MYYPTGAFKTDGHEHFRLFGKGNSIEGYGLNGCRAPPIFNPTVKRRQLKSIIPLSVYFQEASPRYPVDGRTGRGWGLGRKLQCHFGL
jgi:hypothetical protein